jgi:peptide-methionine (S)-S-oxide reductase
MRQRVILAAAIVLALGYAWLRGGFVAVLADQGPPPAASAAGTATATFAAGCFWCVEADFDKLAGVISTTSGYIGGSLKNPTYEQVSRGGTGHTEAVEVVYDPAKVTYEQLLDHFWKNVDPLNAHRQFCDVGDQYRPGIFVHDEAQRKAADTSKAREQQRFKEPVVVEIVAAGPFYRAEAYHQDYYKKNPLQYRYYRWGCGRDQRLSELARKKST